VMQFRTPIGTTAEQLKWLEVIQAAGCTRVAKVKERAEQGLIIVREMAESKGQALLDPRKVNVFEDLRLPAWLEKPKRRRKA